MNQALANSYAFGEFVLHGAERQLFRCGMTVPLAPKVFDTLYLLVENSGHLVEKDAFMRQLWPGTFVGEDALARNISILRKVLGEPNDSQSLIATVPTRGYRFVAPVRRVTDPRGGMPPAGGMKDEAAQVKVAGLPLLQLTPAHDGGSEAASRSWPGPIALVALGIMVGSIAGVVTFHLLSPAMAPRVVRSQQLTHSGRVDPWASVVTDGSRIYFTEREGDHWNLMQTSVSGGDSQIVKAPFRNTVVLDSSPDGSNLLIGSFERRMSLMPLWIWPVQGGALKRVGQIEAYQAVWCPNGREIVYSEDDGIYLADAEGANVRRLARTEGIPGGLSWSPDGHVLRFDLSSSAAVAADLWEVRSDGTQLHPLFPAWNKPLSEGAGTWSSNGKYFFFYSDRSGNMDIWGIRTRTPFLSVGLPEPVRLTSGPLHYSSPVLSRDGRKLFVFGTSGGGELARYDLGSHRAVALFPGFCSNNLVFSPDGAWLGCPSAVDHTLVRMKADGSERIAVTPASLHADGIAWSPDGKRIVTGGLTASGVRRLFLVASDGGAPRELFPDDRNQGDPSWSPDGKLIAFARTSDPSAPGQLPWAIHVLNLSSNQLTLLPNSSGIRAPVWSPDGNSIAAIAEQGHKLMLFNVRNQQWTELAQASFIFGPPHWSKDGESIYFQDLLDAGEPVYRFRLSTGKKERLVSFEDLLRTGVQRVALVSFAPDGSLTLSLDRNVADVYALDLDLP
jgi:Tol biopolymer transport system component/DNA-binding winged helix-turn-helix (wHTH) protein